MHKIILLIDISEEYGQALLKGITRYSKEHGPWVFCKMPLFYRETLGMEGIVNFAKEWGADGIFAQLYNDLDTKKLVDAGICVIAEDFKERFSDIPNITGAYFETGELGAEYFLKKGFRNFAFYGFKNIVWSRERAEGYERHLTAQGYTVHHFDQEQAPSRELWYYKPSALSQWLQSLPKPVAIMACDDERGQHITEACKHAKIQIPEEIAVLGVDNDEMTCNLSDPPLSSIGLDTVRGGYEAARLMDLMINKQVVIPQDIIVGPTQVITRQSTDIASASDKYMAKALKFIHQNIDNRINVADVLREVPFSRRALEKRFQETTGIGVYKYIYNLQIQKFAQRLLETDKTIFEIALEAGFGNSKNISRQFKQVKGCTPNEYRIKHLAIKK
ncbi:MAG: DNA-binding transcriptional regulator [Bacteroidetes bacterium]|nr:DNA-binding transcriptional regulator [Bacteroidota bacterium]